MPFLAERTVPIPNKDILSWMFDTPQFNSEKPIYIDAVNPTRSISADQARSLILQLAAGFQAAGINRGDCVCLHSFNDIYYPILFLGILAAGGIFTGTNPGYTQFELTHHFKISQAKLIITEPQGLAAVLAASENCNISRSKVLIFDPLGQAIPEGFLSWKSLLEHGYRDWVHFDDEEVSKSTTAARLFSSGTTGLPKAAEISHYNLIAQHTMVLETDRVLYQQSRLIYLPMFHAAMVPVAHIAPLRAGDPTYVLPRFELDMFLTSIQKYQITDIIFVPPVALAVIKHPQVRNYSMKSVKHANSGAGPLSKDHQTELQRLLPVDACFTQVWGMTETSCVASKFYYPESDTTGSIGYMMPNLDVKLIDDNGNDITAFDTTGELCIRGPTIINEYFNNSSATLDSFDAEGYFKTGDVMSRASDSKKWYITDRKKELIKVRGFQVSPAEIEGVILTHPGIADAAVIGVKSQTDPDVELPRAYVVRKPGVISPSEEEVESFSAERLAKYKRLTGGVKYIDAIPRNAAGKALKRTLREMFKGEEVIQARPYEAVISVNTNWMVKQSLVNDLF